MSGKRGEKKTHRAASVDPMVALISSIDQPDLILRRLRGSILMTSWLSVDWLMSHPMIRQPCARARIPLGELKSQYRQGDLGKPDVVDEDAKCRGSRKGAIGRQERRVKNLSCGHIKRVVSAYLVSLFPGFPEELKVGDARKLPGSQVPQSQGCPDRLKFLSEYGAPKHR